MTESLEHPSEKSNMSFEESLGQAREIIKRYQSQLVEAEFDVEANDGVIPYQALNSFLRQVPEDIRARYRGHRISRGGRTERLAALLNILDNKSIKGSEGSLMSEAYSAFTHGDYLMLSYIDKPLAEVEGGKTKINDIGFVADVGSVAVNGPSYPLIDELISRYPNVKFVKAVDLPEFMSAESSK
ncbi:MAG: hypothetical protein WC621_03265 [Patescibacteria group bacterium]